MCITVSDVQASVPRSLTGPGVARKAGDAEICFKTLAMNLREQTCNVLRVDSSGEADGGVGLGWVGSRPRLVTYPRSAPPSLRDPTGRPYPGVRSQGLPDC